MDTHLNSNAQSPESVGSPQAISVENRRLALRAAAVGALAAMSVTLSPRKAHAQTRTTLASLQDEVNLLKAALTALDADLEASGMGLNALISQLSDQVDDILAGDSPVGAVEGFVRLAGLPEIADASNAGELRFNPATGAFEGSDGIGWVPLGGGSGSLIQTQMFVSSVRRVLSGTASSHVMDTFLFNKRSPTSSILITGNVSGWSAQAGSLQQAWSLNGLEVMAQGTTYTAEQHALTVPTSTVIAGVAATGNLPLVFRYFSNSGGANRPFIVYNPNSADDSRLSQTRSVYTVFEIES